MTNLLARLFIKDYKNIENEAVRNAYGRLSGMVGIVLNILLSVSKIVTGLLFSALSVTADGINNFSDSASSIITLIGFKMSEKPADDEHPFGHARAEYLAGLFVAIVIILLGTELIKTSVSAVFSPEPSEFAPITVIVLGGSILVKLWMWSFNRSLAKRINSMVIAAAAQDSINDVFTSAAIIAGLLASLITGISFDGYMGLIVGGIIVWSGIKIIKSTLSTLLGEAPERKLVEELAKRIRSYEGVLGIHDLMVHSYGYGQTFASVHVEVDSLADMSLCHDLIDTIEHDIKRELNVNLVIHMDPLVISDETVGRIYEQVKTVVRGINPNLSLHDLRVVIGNRIINIVFDIVLPSKVKLTPAELIKRVNGELSAIDSRYNAVVTVDRVYVGLPKHG